MHHRVLQLFHVDGLTLVQTIIVYVVWVLIAVLLVSPLILALIL